MITQEVAKEMVKSVTLNRRLKALGQKVDATFTEYRKQIDGANYFREVVKHYETAANKALTKYRNTQNRFSNLYAEIKRHNNNLKRRINRMNNTNRGN